MIITDHRGPTAILTVDRRRVHNALDRSTLDALRATFAELLARSDVSVIVITGAGERAFVAGGDLGELSESRGVGESLDLPMQAVFDEIARSTKPTIAAVNGVALGGGLELALACDIRIASDDASFALPELTWSMLPAAGGITRLARVVGPARSLEIVLTGRRVDAQEALQIGLVTTVVSPADLLGAAVALADAISAKAPIATRIARLAAQAAADGSTAAGLIAETLGLAALHGTRDHAEGMRSFAEKRPARFEGK